MEKIKPHEYQKEGVRLIEKLNGRALLADEMGLGKTMQALWTVKRNPTWAPAIVVCPAAVKYNWQHEALIHVNLRSSVCSGTTPPVNGSFDIKSSTPIIIINYKILPYWIDWIIEQDYKTLIIDEAHYCSNPKSQRTKAVRRLAQKCKHVIALTGTPLTNRAKDMWSILNIVWPRVYNSFWSYAQVFCKPRAVRGKFTYNESRNMNLLHDQLKTIGMIRRKKKDVLKDLPDKVHRIYPCALSDYSEYQEASSNFIKWIKKNAGHKISSADNAEWLFRTGTLLRMASRLKMKSVVDWSNTFLEETNEKLVLFAHHKKAISVLKRRIPHKSVVVDGSVNSKDRQIAVNQFQKDPTTKVFIGNIRAAGVGITLTAASTLAFVELPWTPPELDQCSDRIHRIGQTETAWIWYLIAGDTIEEKMCRILNQKRKIINEAIDGDNSVGKFNILEELRKELIKAA